MKAILIAGTHDRDLAGWYSPRSAFVRDVVNMAGHTAVYADGRGFAWSTDLGGVGFGRGDLAVWDAAGGNLFAYAVPPLCPDFRIPPDDLILISHSHGLQVALFALAHGLKATLLVDISGPVRRDMEPAAHAARANVTRWVHVHGGASDRWQWLGALFDGHLGVRRAHPLADVNCDLPALGHSDLVRNPRQYHHWHDQGWLDV